MDRKKRISISVSKTQPAFYALKQLAVIVKFLIYCISYHDSAEIKI